MAMKYQIQNQDRCLRPWRATPRGGRPGGRAQGQLWERGVSKRSVGLPHPGHNGALWAALTPDLGSWLGLPPLGLLRPWLRARPQASFCLAALLTGAEEAEGWDQAACRGCTGGWRHGWPTPAGQSSPVHKEVPRLGISPGHQLLQLDEWDCQGCPAHQ